MPGRCLLNRHVDDESGDRDRAYGRVEGDALEYLPTRDRVLAIPGSGMESEVHVEHFSKGYDPIVRED